MEFRLTYEGPLFGDKKPRPEHKHDIRRIFHKQLAQLYRIHPVLNGTDRCRVSLDDPKNDPIIQKFSSERPGLVGEPMHLNASWHFIWGINQSEYLGEKYRMNGFRFVPIVYDELSLVVSLHVLFLRAEKRGSVINSGDIDGRIKTLFDALQIPKQEQIKGKQPENGEDPFYCLVRDDTLITQLAVETDVLLQPTGLSVDHPENDCRLVITVKLHPYEQHQGNAGF